MKKRKNYRFNFSFSGHIRQRNAGIASKSIVEKAKAIIKSKAPIGTYYPELHNTGSYWSLRMNQQELAKL